jgi:hypothetical protein
VREAGISLEIELVDGTLTITIHALILSVRIVDGLFQPRISLLWPTTSK